MVLVSDEMAETLPGLTKTKGRRSSPSNISLWWTIQSRKHS